MDHQNHNTETRKNKHLNLKERMTIGLMSISWIQKVKLFYAALLASDSH